MHANNKKAEIWSTDGINEELAIPACARQFQPQGGLCALKLADLYSNSLINLL